MSMPPAITGSRWRRRSAPWSPTVRPGSRTATTSRLRTPASSTRCAGSAPGATSCKDRAVDVLVLELPHGIAAAVAVGDGDVSVPGRGVVSLEEALGALLPEEQARAAALSPLRQRDWVAGRLALRAALDRAGLACAEPV